MKLKELIAEFQDIEDLIIEGGGEITSDLEDRLQFTKEEFSNKMIKYESLKRYLKSQVEYLKSQEEHFSKRRKTISNTIKWLGDSQASSMVETGQKKLKTADYSFSIRKTASVNIDYDRIDKIDKSILLSSGLANEVLKIDKTEVKKYYEDKPDLPSWLKFDERWSIMAR